MVLLQAVIANAIAIKVKIFFILLENGNVINAVYHHLDLAPIEGEHSGDADLRLSGEDSGRDFRVGKLGEAAGANLDAGAARG